MARAQTSYVAARNTERTFKRNGNQLHLSARAVIWPTLLGLCVAAVVTALQITENEDS